MVVCGPAAGDDPSIAGFEGATCGLPVDILRLPPLFGSGDGPVAAASTTLRGGGVVTVGELPRVRWLCARDAARVALSMEAGAGTVAVSGEEALSPGEMTDRLAQRFGGRRRAPLWGTGVGAEQAARLRAWATLPDLWHEQWGQRTTFAAWVERLPGPRRRHGPSAPDSPLPPTG